MTNKLLLPHKYKLPGWLLLIPATIAGLALTLSGFDANWLHATVFAVYAESILGKSSSFAFIQTDITNTLVGVVFIIGALLVSFSKEKREDEFIAELRLSSLLWAVLVSYVVLLIAFIFVYGTPFLTVMVYNMFTVLILFIARFQFLLYKSTKAIPNEKLYQG